jgi:hypothetical protein
LALIRIQGQIDILVKKTTTIDKEIENYLEITQLLVVMTGSGTSGSSGENGSSGSFSELHRFQRNIWAKWCKRIKWNVWIAERLKWKCRIKWILR